jgi:outer membrane protein, heavy metal efflux system
MKTFNPGQLTAWISLLAAAVLSSGVMNTAFAQTVSATTPPVSQGASPELSRFVKTSLLDHPDLLAAKADIQSAKATLRASDQAIYNPKIEFDYEDAQEKTKIVGISQTIDWGDQQGSRSGVANARLKRALANYEVATQSIISKLLSGFAEYQTNSELAGLSRETLALMREFKQIAERRYQAGDLNQVELNLARLAYNQALMEQAGALSSATEARENLRAILGVFPTTLPALPEHLPGPDLKDDLQAFLQQLPAIRGQLAGVQAARQQVELRKSEKAWDPTISVTAGSEGDADLLGFNLSIPINVRNTFSAEVDAAQQELIASEQRTQIVYRDTRGRLVMTAERYANLLNAWNSWRENSRNSVTQQLQLIKQLWQTGDISASDYLLQLKQALETQAAGLQLRNQLWQVAFDWMSQTNTIDNWLNLDINSLASNK